MKPEVEVQSLRELIDCEFVMKKEDPDFQLSHFQLIKAAKIMLHKMNVQNYKNQFESEKVISNFKKEYENLK